MKQGEETENGKNNSQEEQKNLGQEQLLNMIANLREEMAEMRKSNSAVSIPIQQSNSAQDIATIVEAAVKGALNSKDKDIDYEAGVDETELPPDDFDEVGARFASPFTGYLIVDDKRKGMRVKIPYNKPSIFFEYAAARRMRQGRYEAIAPYSVYTSKSKKEIEWLRNHSHYGIFFYESATQAVGADVMKMQKLAKTMTQLQNYELIDLIRACKSYNIATGEDPAVMRSALAYAIVDKELEVQTLAAKELLEQTNKELLLSGKVQG